MSGLSILTGLLFLGAASVSDLRTGLVKNYVFAVGLVLVSLLGWFDGGVSAVWSIVTRVLFSGLVMIIIREKWVTGLADVYAALLTGATLYFLPWSVYVTLLVSVAWFYNLGYSFLVSSDVRFVPAFFVAAVIGVFL